VPPFGLVVVPPLGVLVVPPLDPPPPPPPPLAQLKGDMRSPSVRGMSRKCSERCMRFSPSGDWGRGRFSARCAVNVKCEIGNIQLSQTLSRIHSELTATT